MVKNAVDLSDEEWAGNVDELAAAELSVDGKLYGQPAQDLSAVWAVAYNKADFRGFEFRDSQDLLMNSSRSVRLLRPKALSRFMRRRRRLASYPVVP